jgi:dipeptidase
MGCDILVALGRATVDGETLFGHNCNRPGGERLELVRLPGRVFSPGEVVAIGRLLAPQVRRTWTVLASRCPGQWGYQHGLNEHGVSAGLTSIRTRPREPEPGLSASDLVRLALERANSARQAVAVLTDLASRYGQSGAETDLDPAFLIADGGEAYVMEMFGRHWAVQHVHEVRAVSETCHLRQDWDHLSPGLADLAIARGWWPSDGSKLNFAQIVAGERTDSAPPLRRWGRATLLLEQSNGQINLAVLRRVLSDHFEGCADAVDPDSAHPPPEATTLCRHAATPSAVRTAASLIAQVRTDDALPIAWYTFGPPCQSVYFPLVLVGELPDEWPMLPNDSGARRQDGLRAALAGLQARFDGETRGFIAEANELRRRGAADQLPRLAELFMRHNLEAWENLCLEFAAAPARASRARAESEFDFSGAWS